MLGASDEEHLALAASQGRVVFAQDDDFLRLHAKGMRHNGIVYARQGTPIGDMTRGLVLISRVLNASEMQNYVEFLWPLTREPGLFWVSPSAPPLFCRAQDGCRISP